MGKKLKKCFWIFLLLATFFLACKIIESKNSPFRVHSFSASKSILPAGEILLLRCELESYTGSAFDDSLVFKTSKGYFVDPQDSTNLGDRILRPLSEDGVAEASLLNSFCAAEESVWVDITLQDLTRRLGLVFIPGTAGTASPSAIALITAEPNQIGIRGSGLSEVSRITFEVLGAWGLPAEDGVWVEFTKKGPGGSPSDTLLIRSAATQNGKITTAVRSGTRAGPVFISATISGTSLSSQVVPVVIQGGLPHKGNQTLAADQKNIPALAGATAEFRFYGFDVYHNPATEGLAVYFNASSGGVIASDFLDATGVAKTTFTADGQATGFTHIFATTRDDSANLLRDSCAILLSGTTTVGIFNPDSSRITDTLQIANGAAKELLVVACDGQGFPLAGGTGIQISVSSGKLVGESSVQLEDTQDRSRTRFRVQWMDDNAATSERRAAYLNVSVTSRNGNKQSGLWAVLY